MGVPLGPVMAFWLASPLMDPSMFLLTTATLGLEFAIAKTLAAIAIGVFSGTVAALLVRAGLIDGVLREHAGNGGCAGSKIRNPKAVAWTVWNEPARPATGSSFQPGRNAGSEGDVDHPAGYAPGTRVRGERSSWPTTSPP